VAAIFYVGKGQGSRPYSHLREAIEQTKKTEPQVKLCNNHELVKRKIPTTGRNPESCF